MTIGELEIVLKEFDRNYGHVQSSAFVHGIQAVIEDGRPIVEVLVEPDAKDRANVAALGLPEQFSFESASGTTEVKVVVIAESLPRAMGEMGAEAKGKDLGFSGTLGWNIKLDDLMVCLSNWHIFCVQGNATPYGGNDPDSPGLEIYVNHGLEARLLNFVPVYPDRDNGWELALGEYIHEDDWVASVRSCEGGTLKHTYPTEFTPEHLLRPGSADVYWTVGRRPPICESGTLRGIAQFRRIGPYNDGNYYRFNDQLVFSCMMCPGDSGALAVHEATNTVTGLLFASNAADDCTGGTTTIANPLYKVPWSFRGVTEVAGTQSRIPVFESTEAFRASLMPRASAAPVEVREHDRDLTEMNNLVTGGATSSETDNGLGTGPSMQTGFSVLGFAIERRRRRPPHTTTSWQQEEPSGTLRKFLVRVDPFGDYVLLFYLCLGKHSAGRPVKAIGFTSRPDTNRWCVSTPESVQVEDPGLLGGGRMFKGWSPHGTDLILGEADDTDSHFWVLGETVHDRFGEILRQPMVLNNEPTTTYPLLEEFTYESPGSIRGGAGRWVRKTVTSITLAGVVPKEP